MSQFAFLCLILFMGQHYAVGYLDHNYEYAQDAETWLRLHMLPDYWPDARRLCQLEGGILASPSTSELAEVMLRIMHLHKVREVFTGIHALITEGEYESLDGVPLADIPLDWEHHNPHHNRLQHCVVLNATGKVNDVSCTDTYPYFCRKETDVMKVCHVCHTTVSGYEFEPRTGSCYKFHRYADMWHRAARTCEAEGGNLVIVNSDTESQVVQEIFKKNPNETIVGAESKDAAMVGIWKWGILFKGEWQSVHGQTLEKVGFARWSKDANENAATGNYAAAIERTGLLVPVRRYDKYPFICEIEISTKI